MSKKIIITGVVAAIGLAGLSTASYALAAPGPGHDTLIDSLVKKFSLDRQEVEKVFDAQHQARQTAREQDVQNELSQLVKSGSLTQEQSDKLLAKRAEFEKERQANQPARQGAGGSDRQARHAQMSQKRIELDQWLKDNSIDARYGALVMPGYMNGGPSGRGKGHQMRIHQVPSAEQ